MHADTGCATLCIGTQKVCSLADVASDAVYDPKVLIPCTADCAQVRCLVDVPGDELPRDMAQHLEQVVMPEIPEQLRPAFHEAVAARSWRSMRNKSMPARPLHRPGALLLGERVAHAP